VRRKIFRIEETYAVSRPAAADLEPAPLADGDDSHHALHCELAELRDRLARNKSELAALIGDGNDRRMARAAGELGAAAEAMETAADAVLKSAESIDEYARALGASLKSDYERGLAQDIQDRLIAIYEACNFQDIAGQRIGKVIETLMAVETQISAMLGRPIAAEPPVPNEQKALSLINGPKLDGDSGHASQRDIDAMFA
jgi:chemotaxis protein CheZ